jgi:hypothetical protein
MKTNNEGVTMATIGAMAHEKVKKDLEGFSRAIEILKQKKNKKG